MADDSFPAILGGPPVRPAGPPEWPGRDPEIVEALARAAADGTWGKYRGPHTRRLAEMLAGFHGCAHAILCSSGTAAIELALRGLSVSRGDEVILAAYDFKGNFLDVLAVGARPVLVDVEPGSARLDLRRIEAAFSPQTKAVIVSHLHGCVAEMPALMSLAADRGVGVVEDACQCPGAIVHGRRAGAWGDAGVISFGGSKLLSAGRGGAVLTNHSEVAQRIRIHAFRGNDAYPLSELQACVVIPQLEKLDERNRRRERSVELLRAALPVQKGLTMLDGLAPDSRPAYYKAAFRYDPSAFAGLTRDQFIEAMRAEGIAVDAGFRSLAAIHGRGRYRAAGEIANAAEAGRSLVVLHHPVLLEDAGDVLQFVEALDKIRRHARIIVEGPARPKRAASNPGDDE